MQQKSKLEIKTLSVQIRVLTIDQKRFTKSVFDQLPWGLLGYYDQGANCVATNCEVIGYVRVKIDGLTRKVGLFVKDGQLFKARAKEYENFDFPNMDWDDINALNQRIENHLLELINKSTQLFISI